MSEETEDKFILERFMAGDSMEFLARELGLPRSYIEIALRRAMLKPAKPKRKTARRGK